MKLNELSFAFLEKIISYFIDIPKRGVGAPERAVFILLRNAR